MSRALFSSTAFHGGEGGLEWKLNPLRDALPRVDRHHHRPVSDGLLRKIPPVEYKVAAKTPHMIHAKLLWLA